MELYPTPHLLEKFKARDVTWAEILDIANNPDVVYNSGFNRKVMQKDDLAIVVSNTGYVLTVLLRDGEQWNDEQARNRQRNINGKRRNR